MNRHPDRHVLDYASGDETWISRHAGFFAVGLLPAAGCCVLGGLDAVFGDPPNYNGFRLYHVAVLLIALLAIAWLATLFMHVLHRRVPAWTLLFAIPWITFIIWLGVIFILDVRAHPAGQNYLSRGMK